MLNEFFNQFEIAHTDLDKAFTAGYNAHKNGKARISAHDTVMMELTKGFTVENNHSESMSLAAAFYEGYDASVDEELREKFPEMYQ